MRTLRITFENFSGDEAATLAGAIASAVPSILRGEIMAKQPSRTQAEPAVPQDALEYGRSPRSAKATQEALNDQLTKLRDAQSAKQDRRRP
jgi:hypothetical protein